MYWKFEFNNNTQSDTKILSLNDKIILYIYN